MTTPFIIIWFEKSPTGLVRYYWHEVSIDGAFRGDVMLDENCCHTHSKFDGKLSDEDNANVRRLAKNVLAEYEPGVWPINDETLIGGTLARGPITNAGPLVRFHQATGAASAAPEDFRSIVAALRPYLADLVENLRTIQRHRHGLS